MKSKGLVLVYILSIIPQIGISQSLSKFGLEVGISFSQFTVKDYEKPKLFWIETSKISPLISPLIGISREWKILNHFQFKSGLQFHNTGTRTYLMDKYDNGIGYSETWENIRIYKICLPLVFEYLFKIGELQPSVYLGMRPNFIVSGSENSNYHSHYKIDERDAGFEDEYYEDQAFLNPHKRLMNQYLIGISTAVGKHFKINLSYNLGHNYSTTEYTYHGMYTSHIITEKKTIPSSDYIVSMIYKFNKPETGK
jgi:hypothetical protein